MIEGKKIDVMTERMIKVETVKVMAVKRVMMKDYEEP